MTTTTLDEAVVPETYFAPAARADDAEVRAAREAFLAGGIPTTFLEAMPDAAMVLNAQRQIVAANARLLAAVGADSVDGILGLRPGEAVGCVHAHDGPGGCGTGPYCSVCGAVRAIVDCLESRGNVAGQCRIQTNARPDGGALDLEARASFLVLDHREMVVLALRDISAEKRRSVLERAFLHDLLNVAGGITSAADLLNREGLAPRVEERAKRALLRLSRELADEIDAQRQLLSAEKGDLSPRFSCVPAPEMVRSVAEMYRDHTVARDRVLSVGALPECAVVTDPTLLRRVLGNLLKNALEATPTQGVVTLEAEALPDAGAFSVHNPGEIPDEVCKQIFQRSFSTKGEAGRGIGTYSVKLLTERYLGGRVDFTSRAAEGTRFTVALPR